MKLLSIPLLCLVTASCVAAQGVDFTREVQPILAEHCYVCHGADDQAREGGLRLDLRDAALGGGDGYGPAIVPGHPNESALIVRVTAEEAYERMPPEGANSQLSDADVEVLKRWIAEGAEYAEHWAFTPPQAASLPSEVHPVDSFVEAHLAGQGLVPSPPADGATLCRRLYLDLIGLPPSPAAIAQFERQYQNDPQAAVEHLVGELLELPAFGEKWARLWLDAARYSDSNGYEKDLPREQWAWRDWVIDAINRDMPYDQFIVEQIAGDLLPNATQSQIVATGFLRNSMINEEGAIVPEEFRMEEMFDRIDCVGKSVLGLTLQCARCHTHKFDPLTHDEYFGMFAFLNNAYEAQSPVFSEEQLAEIEAVRKTVRQAERELIEQKPEWDSEMAAWQADVRSRQAEWSILLPTELGSISGLNHPTLQPDGSILSLGHPSNSGEIYAMATPDLLGVTGLRLEALPHGSLPAGGPGRSRDGSWAVSELKVSYRQNDSDDWTPVELTGASADFAEAEGMLEAPWEEADDRPEDRRRGPVAFLIDGDEKTAWRADRGEGLRNQPSVAVVQFAEPLSLSAGTNLRVQLFMKHGASGSKPRYNAMLGCCRISLTKAPDPRAESIDHAAILAMERPPDDRTTHEKRAIFNAWRKTLAGAEAINVKIAEAWEQYPQPHTTVLHLAEREGLHRRTTHLLERGEWSKPSHAVEPQTPEFLHPLQTEGDPNRLAFARWLVDERSPLTARVAVNRVWQALFGLGLVQTPEDFGTRAAVPIHRDLLDWLAVDLMEHRWRRKHLIRRIVTSATYRQDSRVTPQLRELDPQNELLARGPRFRLDAEVIRDSALQIAGLLDRQIGGPSIFPPVPESVLDSTFVRPDYWRAPTPPDRYRRALYAFRKRTMPDPVLCTLDAPNGDYSIARRARSNTPLGALVTLNETVFVEAAQALAQRVLREGGSDDAARADYAYRLCTGRTIGAADLQALLQLLHEQRQRLTRGELQATDIAFSKQTDLKALPADATPNDLAAWTIVSRVLLNLDATLTKS